MKKITTILFSILLFTSCSEDKIVIENLTLNNGEKWEANIETTEGIDKMEKLIYEFHEFYSIDYANLEEIHNLNSGLKKEFNKIIKSCNMEGEAHEQLHHYIKPILLNYFKKIDTDDIDLARKGLKDLNKHLNEYKNYFN